MFFLSLTLSLTLYLTEKFTSDKARPEVMQQAAGTEVASEGADPEQLPPVSAGWSAPVICMPCVPLQRSGPWRLLSGLLVLLSGLALTACGSLGYYGQAALGHLDIMSRRQPIESVLQQPSADELLKQRLQQVQDLVHFATDELGLDTGSAFTSYADIGRPYVMWQLVAAEEFSVQPRSWCFPVAGCVAYRGYFSEAAARRFGRKLGDRGYEVSLGGVAAYSTLGYFSDPVLSNFIYLPAADLAALLLHEIGHRQLYVPSDSRFNEGFATALEQIAVQLYLTSRGQEQGYLEYRLAREERAAFMAFLLPYRQQLHEIYRRFPGELSAMEARQRKMEVYADLQEAYRLFRINRTDRFDGWMSGINNARIAGLATYQEYVPGLMRLYEHCDRNLSCWMQEVEQLTLLDLQARAARLQACEEGT